MPTSALLGRRESPAVLGYAVAVLSVAAAVAIDLGFERLLGDNPTVSLLLCAILLVAWASGTGPALLATALAVLAFDYFFLEPVHSFPLQFKDVPRLGFFAIAALFVVALSAAQRRATTALRRTRDEQQETVRQLQALNETLRTENAERKQAEQRAQFAEQELRAIIDTIPVLVLRHRADGVIDFVNQVGRSYSGIVSTNWTRRTSVITHPDDVSRLEEAWDIALATGEPFETEARLRRGDGEYRWFASRRAPLRNSDGEVIAWYAATYDIEDRKRAEDALRRSEAELARARQDLQLTIDTISTMVVVLDQDGKPYFANRPAQEYIGRDVSVENVRDLIHPDDRDWVDRLWRTHLATGEPFQTEQRMLRADGQYRWNYMTRVPLRDETGKVIKWFGSGYDIEDRKRAETALQEREAQLAEARRELQLTIDSIPVMVSTFEPDGTRSFVNQTWQNYTGHTQPEATGEGLDTSAYYHPDDVGRFENAWRAAQEKGEMLSVDVRTRRADGAYRWYTMRRAPQRDEKGNIVKWYSVGVDVEDQKIAENAVRRSEARLASAERELRLMIDSIPVMVTTYQPDGRRIFVNEAWQRFTGLSQEEACSGDLTIPVHPDHRDLGDRLWQASLATGEPFVQEKRLQRADGQYRWHWVRRVPLRDETGKIIRWYGAGFDIEDQKQAESALKRSEAQLAKAERELRRTLDLIPTLAWRTRADGYAEYLNKRWLDYTGLPLGQALGWEWQAAIHPDDRPALHYAWLRMLETGKPDEVEARMRRFDGTYRWFLFRAEALRDEAGAVVAWYGTNTDIEDRKQAESAWQRSQAHSAEAQKLSQTGSFAWEVATRDYYWSEQTYQILGFDRSVKPSISLVVQRTHPDDRFMMERELNRSAQRAPYHDFEVRLLMPDGQIRHIHLLAHRIKYQSGNEEIVGAVMDVTEARRSQETLQAAQTALAHASRVATLGEISATIAHEVNQPLAAIVANGQACLRFLRREKPDLNDVRGAVEWMVKDGNRAGEVIRRVRGLLKNADTEKTPLDVNDLVNEVAALLRRELAAQQVSPQLELAPAVPPVIADRVQLQQVIINLVMNGAEAMQTITDRSRRLVIRTCQDEADRVVVAVEDSGPGIASENADRVFDPFFSTKPGGLGMGLSICRSIVEAHGGRLWSSANAGPGATFQFALPQHPESAA